MAAKIFQSDDGGGGSFKSPRSPGHSQADSSPWSSIVQGPVTISDTVSTVAPTPTFSSSVEEQIGNFTSCWCPPTTVPEIATSPDDSGTDGQGSDSGGVGGSSASKKPVWNKPSNGVVEVVNPVMGAVSWPALGESTPKSSSSESLKALADGPLPPALQVTGNSSPSHKPTTANNVHPTSTPNHVAPARQRSMKRGGGSFNSNVSANGGVSYTSATSHDLVAENPKNPHNTSGKPGATASESSPRDQKHIESQRAGFGAQSHNGNDHQHQRNSYRRGNGGRGDGSYHHGYGGKRDQDRGNHEWNQHSRSFNSRDTQFQPQRGYPRGYIRPSVHTSAPFIPPPMSLPVRSFGNNLMYPDMPSPVFYVQGPPPPPESLRTMPLVAPIPPPMYFAVPDPLLHARIVSQIDYYFSNENLIKDTYLRKNMDEQGWVPVSLIAGFKKVLYLTDNVQLILDAMRTSTIVEVQGDKIRRRNDWMRWLMHPPGQYSSSSSPQAVGRSPNQDILASQLQGVALDGTTPTSQASVETFFGRSSSGEFNSQLQGAGGGEAGRVGGQQAGQRATLA